MKSSRDNEEYPDQRFKNIPRYLCILGYVGGSAGTDVSQPGAVAVTIQIQTEKREDPFETELSGRLYNQFKRQGLIYEDAMFRIDYYVDGKVDVVPIDAPVRKRRGKTRGLESLEIIQEAKIKEALGRR